MLSRGIKRSIHQARTYRCCARALLSTNAEASLASAGEESSSASAKRGGAASPLPLYRSIKLATHARFANREDIKAAFRASGHENDIQNIDALIHKGMFTSTLWLIEFKTEEVAQALISAGHLKGPTGTMKVDKITENDLYRMELSSQHGINECFVRVQNVPAGMGEDEMAHFFRHFEVKAPGGIREVERIEPSPARKGQQKGGPPTGFLVEFTSPDEAQRAIREKQHAIWGDNKIYITSFK